MTESGPDSSRRATKCRALINEGTEDEMSLVGYQLVRWRQFASWLLILLTGGLAWLVFYWVPRWRLAFTHRKEDLEKADAVLIIDEYMKYTRYYVKPVFTATGKGGVDTTSGPTSGGHFEIPSRFGSGFRRVDTYRYFRCQKVVYLWEPDDSAFFALHGLDAQMPCKEFHEFAGLTREEQEVRRRLYGPNKIVIPKQPLLHMLVKEVLNPFYVFQVFSVLLWYIDEYHYYATAIVIMSVGGISTAVYQAKVNQNKLRETILSTDSVIVCRGQDRFETISSDELVPGDVIEIPAHGCEMHCDAVLISGTAIVNESLLTGESVPVTKTIIPKFPESEHSLYDAKEHSRNTLFGGTTVVQTRNYKNQKVLAVVQRTGFLTSKGRLVCSILYPAPVDFKFEQDSYKFVFFLSCIASLGFFYTVVRKVIAGASFVEIALDALDLITITVPPALPAAMTIGSLYAQKRLAKKGVFCMSQRTINVSGSVDCICFDKTGTLTEDGLDMWGVVPVSSGQGGVVANGQDIEKWPIKDGNIEEEANLSFFEEPEKNPDRLNRDRELVQAMSTCHSLTLIQDELCGDPLDLIMFQSTGWSLVEPTDEEDGSMKYDNLAPTFVRPPNMSAEESLEHEIGVTRQFPFSSSRQCMSVVVRKLGVNHFTVFCKGSPEKILSLAQKASVPKNFHEVLQSYTETGHRVLAVGSRHLDKSVKWAKVQKMTREEAEQDLQLLGLIILENRLKSETTPIIRELASANLRTIMVTGDNINTAVSVARECGMIQSGARVYFVRANHGQGRDHVWFVPANENRAKAGGGGSSSSNGKVVQMEDEDEFYQFAIDGKNFDLVRHHFPHLLDRLVVRGAVFARMSPEQKQVLVELLQELGYYVSMCGDGANDCGALRAAHAGISLSDAESSVASPFTSREPNISCVPQLVREGRCALVTSFGIFKYMAAYSLTQFASVLLLYDIESNLSDFQFLYIDLFLITTFAFFFGLTEAYEGALAPHPPMKSLVSFTSITSLLLQLVSIVGFQVAALVYVKTQDWFVPFDYENPTYNQTRGQEYYEASTIDDSEVASWENYAIFSVSAFQYIILAYAFSKSRPYRKWVITNYWLVASLLLLTGVTIYFVLAPSIACQALMELLLPPSMEFRLTMLAFVAANVLVCVLLEDGLVEYVVFRWIRKSCHNPERSKRRYLSVENWMKSHCSDWPTVTSEPGEQANQGAPGRHVTASRPIRVDMEVVQSADEAFEHFSPHNATTSAVSQSSHTTAATLLNTSLQPIAGLASRSASPSARSSISGVSGVSGSISGNISANISADEPKR